jgi:hypothetical protein
MDSGRGTGATTGTAATAAAGFGPSNRTSVSAPRLTSTVRVCFDPSSKIAATSTLPGMARASSGVGPRAPPATSTRAPEGSLSTLSRPPWASTAAI